MGSWPFLIYMIDVLTTDGAYGGWVFLLIISALAYIGLYIGQKSYESSVEESNNLNSQTAIFTGLNLTLNQNWSTFKAGDVIIVSRIDHSDSTVKVTLPNSQESNWIPINTLRKVTAVVQPSVTPSVPVKVNDVTKGPRKIAVLAMVVCFLGVFYANFMPQKETAYKMLAAYVGQNIIESPRTQQLADTTIKYLDSQIKKYTTELDAAEKAQQAEKAKESK